MPIRADFYGCRLCCLGAGRRGNNADNSGLETCGEAPPGHYHQNTSASAKKSIPQAPGEAGRSRCAASFPGVEQNRGVLENRFRLPSRLCLGAALLDLQISAKSYLFRPFVTSTITPPNMKGDILLIQDCRAPASQLQHCATKAATSSTHSELCAKPVRDVALSYLPTTQLPAHTHLPTTATKQQRP